MKGLKDLPKNFKYGRVFRIKLKHKKLAGSFLKVNFLNFGLKSLEIGKLTINHLKMILKIYKKLLKYNFNLKINVSMLIPVTKKPLEMRMGKGKGSRSFWEFNVLNGCILLELSGIEKIRIYRCLSLIVKKLPINCKIVKLIF